MESQLNQISDEESARLRSLSSFDLLDTIPEEAFDDLVQVAASICDTPISALSLIDANRQWFKAKLGFAVNETPRDIAFCSIAIQQPDEVLIVDDASKDARFSENPLVLGDPNIRFYAGVPLVVENGHALGTICVIDTKSRHLSDNQLMGLRALGRRVVAQLIIRKTNQELSRRNDELSQFSYRISHDFKSPLTASKRLAEFLLEDLEAGEMDEVKTNALRIHKQMSKLEGFVEDMLELARADLSKNESEEIDLYSLIEEIRDHHEALIGRIGAKITVDSEPNLIIRAPRVRLQQMLTNLISNALKYHNPLVQEPFVKIGAKSLGSVFEICVSDNGIGIPVEYQDQVGQLFTRFHPGVASGSGLGLSIVYKHAAALKSEIELHSSDAGTRFTFRIPDST